MKFPKGNKIVFGQDHAWWEGVPPDVDFEVDEIWKDGKIWMKAPGYGGKPYGNGSIVLYLKTVDNNERVYNNFEEFAKNHTDDFEEIHTLFKKALKLFLVKTTRGGRV